LIYYF
jgi:hypothetical protein